MNPEEDMTKPTQDQKVKKPRSKYFPVIITALVALVVVCLASGGVWYYMNQKIKKNEEVSNIAIADSAKELATVQAQNDAMLLKATKTTTQSTINVTSSSADIDTLRTFCLSGGGSNKPEIRRLQYVTTPLGTFAECAVSEAVSGGSGIAIYSKKAGTGWEKLALTNNVIDKAACEKYKIPHEISTVCTD